MNAKAATDVAAVGKLRFSGPALNDGVMPIRDLAPAITALAEFIEEASRAVNGDEAPVTVSAVSGFKRGSFIVDFSVQLDVPSQILAFAAGSYAMGAHELLKSLGIHASASLSVLDLMKWLRGKRVEKADVEGDSVTIKIEGDNNTVVVAPRSVWEISKSESVARAAYRMAHPLRRAGIDELQFRDGRKVVERIRKSDLAALEQAAKKLPEPVVAEEAILSDSTDEITIDLLSGVFSETESFRFFDGESKFYARITDSAWWDKIHGRLDGYFEGDRMRVRRVSRQFVDAGGRLHREYEITSVLRHDHTPTQGDLFGAA